MSDAIKKAARFLDMLNAEWSVTYLGKTFWDNRRRKVRALASSLRKEAARSEADTHPVTGTLNTNLTTLVKEFIEKHPRGNATTFERFQLVDLLCKIVKAGEP